MSRRVRLTVGLGHILAPSLFGTPRPKTRIVASMNVEPSTEFVIANYRPTAATRRVGVAEAFPGELGAAFITGPLDSAIEPAFDRSEWKDPSPSSSKVM
jgi:hypothetical protein